MDQHPTLDSARASFPALRARLGRLDPTGALVVAALSVFAVRAVLLLAVIPPWQQPDEPAHVSMAAVARSWSLQEEMADVGRQSEILRSLARYDWWRYYEAEAPVPVPRVFSEAGPTLRSDPMVAYRFRNPYYRTVGFLLAQLPSLTVEQTLHLMRGASAFFGLLTLLAAWRGARLCLGAEGGAGVTALLALHSQFAVVATTAGPDAAVNLLGACVWWQVAAAARRCSVVPVASLLLAGLAAAMIDRAGEPLALTACLAAAVLTLAPGSGLGRPIKAALAGAAVLTLGTAWWQRPFLSWALLSDLDRLQSYLTPVNWGYLPRFLSLLFQSWWASYGWLKYLPPWWWLTVALMVSGTAALGLARVIRHRVAPIEAWRARRNWLAVALVGFIVQVLAVFWAFFREETAAQGRYLLPWLVPTLLLLWVGVEARLSTRLRPYAGVGLVALFALLDVTALGFVALPAFAR